LDDYIFNSLLAFLVFLAFLPPIIYLVKHILKVLDMRRWKKSSKKYHLTPKEIQAMRDRAKNKQRWD
jgi:hypothetical protein